MVVLLFLCFSAAFGVNVFASKSKSVLVNSLRILPIYRFFSCLHPNEEGCRVTAERVINLATHLLYCYYRY
jgi:hypothetical protein